MNTRIDRLDRNNYIELAVKTDSYSSYPTGISVKVGPPRKDGADFTFTLGRREAYQIADTLRAMAFSFDHRLT